MTSKLLLKRPMILPYLFNYSHLLCFVKYLIISEKMNWNILQFALRITSEKVWFLSKGKVC